LLADKCDTELHEIEQVNRKLDEDMKTVARSIEVSEVIRDHIG